MTDGLMGADRDLTQEVKEKTRKRYDDPGLDKHFLCGCSPYELLSDTKVDKMLPNDGWGKIADIGLARDFQALPQEEKVFR